MTSDKAEDVRAGEKTHTMSSKTGSEVPVLTAPPPPEEPSRPLYSWVEEVLWLVVSILFLIGRSSRASLWRSGANGVCSHRCCSPCL
jgi:hypothetical protein